MTGNDVERLPIERLAPRIRSQELSASDLLERALARIDAHESTIKAFSHVSEHARDTARRLDDDVCRAEFTPDEAHVGYDGVTHGGTT